jgi:hypothetical protein
VAGKSPFMSLITGEVRSGTVEDSAGMPTRVAVVDRPAVGPAPNITKVIVNSFRRLVALFGIVQEEYPIIDAAQVLDEEMFEQGLIGIKKASAIAGVPVDFIMSNMRIEKWWPKGFPQQLRDRHAWIKLADAERILRERSTAINQPRPPVTPSVVGEIVAFDPAQLVAPSKDDAWNGTAAPKTEIVDEGALPSPFTLDRRGAAKFVSKQ